MLTVLIEILNAIGFLTAALVLAWMTPAWSAR